MSLQRNIDSGNGQLFYLKIYLTIPPPWQYTLLIIRPYIAVTLSRMNYQLLEYSCSECGTLLKKTIGDACQDLLTINVKEECPKCGSTLKNLKKKWNNPSQSQQLYDKYNKRRSLASQSPILSSKFQTAYDEFTSKLMFDIEALDSSLQSLNTDGNTLAIIGDNNHSKNSGKFSNILLTRLCIYSLFLLRRQEGFRLSSTPSSSSPLLPHVVIVDAGNSLDFYQFVEFIRQYGLDIRETLQKIVVSRAFTVYQLTNLIINELPNIVRQLDTCLVIVPDLLHMFTHDPNIDRREAKYLIKEIVSAIRKIAISSSRTRCVVSWNYHHQSSVYIKILLPIFDKYIQVTSLGRSSSLSSFPQLNIKINLKMGKEYCSCNKNNGNSNSNNNNKSCNNSRHCLLQVRDIYFVPQMPK
jgi:DNA-directed RNA polymerase subunit RPC12/RpoP